MERARRQNELQYLREAMLRARMEQVQPNTKERTRSSRVLEDLLRQAPPECFRLGWLMSNLQQRSFGIVVLFLGLIATTPIGSTVPGVMLAVVALQMIAGRHELVFPQCITARNLPTRYLFRVGEHAIPVMHYLEKAVHPRWPTAFEAIKRFVGVVVLLLTAALLLTPVPLSNIAPAIVIALISLAYLEEDGLLLCFALLAAVILISVASAAVWGTIVGASFISRIW
jgi:hypothetical protein